MRQPLMQLTEATIHTLHDYADQLWSDVITDRYESIRAAMLDFLSQIDQGSRTAALCSPRAKVNTLGFSTESEAQGIP